MEKRHMSSLGSLTSSGIEINIHEVIVKDYKHI